MTKEEKKIIKQLKKEKNFEGIYFKFGQKAYNKYADKEYKENDLAKLEEEGKYESIYLKYGEHQYNKLLRKIKQKEIELECGKYSINAIKNRIKVTFGAILTILGISQLSLVTSTVVQSETIKSRNEIKYKDEIEAYINRN